MPSSGLVTLKKYLRDHELAYLRRAPSPSPIKTRRRRRLLDVSLATLWSKARRGRRIVPTPPFLHEFKIPGSSLFPMSNTALRRHFASDNYAGIAPEAWAALEEANRGHAPAYGNDPWTQHAADMIRKLFETPCEVFFVFNGTAAIPSRWPIAARAITACFVTMWPTSKRTNVGAPEFFANGSKLLLLPGAHGKLTPEGIEEAVLRRSDIHYPKPRIVSVTQSTEVGTVSFPGSYGPSVPWAKKHGLRFHMDGARFANAVATLGVAPREITTRQAWTSSASAGPRTESTGEAVVFNRDLAREFDYRAKQGGQLCSKMRFVAAPGWAC